MRSLSAILIALVLASTIQIIPWVEPNPVLEELVKGPPYDGDRYHFTQNDGQWTDGVLFGAHTDFGSVAFSIGSVHYISTDNGGVPTHRYHPIQLSFIGSDGARPSGEEPLDFPTNYIMGRDANCWIFGAKSYRRILYQDLWEGIDLVYFFTSSELKYEFILGPGSDPRDIRIRLDGHSSLSCAGNMLAIGTGGSPCIIDSDLYVHYEDGPDEVLPGSFVMIDESTYSFDVDPPGDRTVIIDPVVSGGYIGGSGTDSISSTVELQDGDIMICGTCDSPGLPIRMNGYDATFNGGADGFIIRKASDDGGIRSATYIGGSHDDHINSMAVSDSGGLYICGLTYSDDFPVTKLAFDDSFNGDTDVFVMGFDSNLLEPTFSTYIGGSGQENSFSISIGKQDRPVVAGNTVSDDFPVVNGSFDTNFSGGSDMFLLMLEKDGSDLIFSSFIGGSGGEIPKDMEISPGGDIYITGLTSSQDFPVSINAMDRTYSGGNDLFVFGLGADGDSMVASTFVGGTGWDDGFGLHIDDDGSILVTGFTRST
ncbi:MAG: SBBP repeat-containing protein, partial [Candidatus Thermoplasmatota archaeon]|nr:SBBP repeat-containing protein [Candidatus Thermoplasmatota archaeon]